MITHMLSVKIRTRYTVDKALLHVWLQDYCLWCDLRRLEAKMSSANSRSGGAGRGGAGASGAGQQADGAANTTPLRFLTYEVDDERWDVFRKEKGLPAWESVGHNLDFSRSGILVATLRDL